MGGGECGRGEFWYNWFERCNEENIIMYLIFDFGWVIFCDVLILCCFNFVKVC